MTTAQDVAQWMAERVDEFYLPQDATAQEIFERFGEPFASATPEGTWTIAPAVLKAFNKLTKDTVVWVRSTKYWRKRERSDPPRSREVDW